MSWTPPTAEQLEAVTPEDRAELLQIVCAIVAAGGHAAHNSNGRYEIVNSAGALLQLTKEKAASMKAMHLL